MAMIINPIPNLNAALGLYLLSHHLEKIEANVIIKKEFKIENQDTVISDTSLVNSVFNIHSTIAQIPPKHRKSTILDDKILFLVCLKSINSTHVIKIKGITVSSVLTILNIVRAFPSRARSVKSLANR